MDQSTVPDLVVNGRFLTRSLTGVDRVAREIVIALAAFQRSSENTDAFRLDIAVPKTSLSDAEIRNTLGLSRHSTIFRSRFGGYFWEQVILPRVANRAVLLSLCNMGPIFRKRQFALIHDVQVFDAPQSYSRSFRTAYRSMQPTLTRNAGWIASVSQNSAKRMRASGLGTGRTIHILPNGADHMARIAENKGAPIEHGLEPGKYFLAVGSLAVHKNLSILAQANKLRSERTFPLALVGAVDERVFGSAESLRQDGIKLLGRVDDESLKALYCRARALLLPSLTEGFGLAAVEAMVCGCPVVVSGAGALRETCGEAAVYCDPRDARAWATAMDRLSTDQNECEALSLAGVRRAEEFSWTASARKLLSIVSVA